jgi:CSLREA domain-containing protein
MRVRGKTLGAIAVSGIVLGRSPAPSHAAAFTVDSSLDSADAAPGDGVCAAVESSACTLRAAIEEANALLPGSQAIDAGDTSGCPSTDQRGAPRPVDGNGDGTPTCDIGAYEAPP